MAFNDPVHPGRRSVLGVGLAASSLFLPLPYAWVWAQSDGTLKLLKLPKIALVLGNSKYKEAPLKNPANDAKAIGDALKTSGFDVTLKMDAGKADMAAAVQAYVAALAAKKCVGLFYYAGHGIQLAWRNYMLPVDADVDTIADIQKQGVEVNALMEGISKAANPMNIVILDACRDNPFGNLKGIDHKGLSQMDAPQSTLLAYATSPGNVASDGSGANGLYTENLLREIKAPEAKIEDVFKRVRLNVRIQSKGAQIPWESTSLEEDFWFNPPKELKKLSDAEKEKAFNEELAAWEKINGSNEPGPLEEFVRRYPNGNFSEIAQLQLDRVLARQGEKKIQIASQQDNPYTKGTVQANTMYKIGDSYTYREVEVISKAELRTFTETVKEITDQEVIYDNGSAHGLLGNATRQRDGRILSPRQELPLEYAVGKTWKTRHSITNARGDAGYNEWDFRVVGKDRITIPAGTFDAWHVVGRGFGTSMGGSGTRHLELNKWMAPERLRRPLVTSFLSRSRGIFGDRFELVSFKEA